MSRILNLKAERSRLKSAGFVVGHLPSEVRRVVPGWIWMDVNYDYEIQGSSFDSVRQNRASA